MKASFTEYLWKTTRNVNQDGLTVLDYGGDGPSPAGERPCCGGPPDMSGGKVLFL